MPTFKHMIAIQIFKTYRPANSTYLLHSRVNALNHGHVFLPINVITRNTLTASRMQHVDGCVQPWWEQCRSPLQLQHVISFSTSKWTGSLQKTMEHTWRPITNATLLFAVIKMNRESDGRPVWRLRSIFSSRSRICNLYWHSVKNY